MNLRSKKELASETLKVGKSRIVFVDNRLIDIKEAITKQDIRDLVKDGAILVLPTKGRKTVVRRKNAKGPGKIKKKVNKRKATYVKLTRKLRAYLSAIKDAKGFSSEEVKEIRKQIRNKKFRSLANFKELIGGQKR
jgi:large subunit ribosomal protein L19e